MNPVLLHIHFPHAGPWGADLADAFGALADDIATEPGLAWKLWLEDAAAGRAGGAYLFDSRAQAERYLAKHRERLAQWGITALEVTMHELNPALSRRSKAAPALDAATAVPPGTAAAAVPGAAAPAAAAGEGGPFTTWAEVAIEDFDRFLQVFSSAGLAARRRHGSRAAQVFRVAGEPQSVRVLIDWRDRASFETFVADPDVKATMRSGGALRPPVFTAVERAAAFGG